jgi:hypothetical protein
VTKTSPTAQYLGISGLGDTRRNGDAVHDPL